MPNDLCRVEWRGNLAGQFRNNVQHWIIGGATSDLAWSNANDLANFLTATIRPKWKLMMPIDYVLDSLVVRRIGPTGGPYAQVDWPPGSEVGTRGTGAVSEQLCPCITLIPPMGVKSAGKIFLPAVDKADINMNVPTASYITAVNNFMAACVLGGSVAGGTATMVIYSRKLNVSHAISTYHLSPVLGYQRKRSRPVGS